MEKLHGQVQKTVVGAGREIDVETISQQPATARGRSVFSPCRNAGCRSLRPKKKGEGAVGSWKCTSAAYSCQELCLWNFVSAPEPPQARPPSLLTCRQVSDELHLVIDMTSGGARKGAQEK